MKTFKHQTGRLKLRDRSILSLESFDLTAWYRDGVPRFEIHVKRFRAESTDIISYKWEPKDDIMRVEKLPFVSALGERVVDLFEPIIPASQKTKQARNTKHEPYEDVGSDNEDPEVVDEMVEASMVPEQAKGNEDSELPIKNRSPPGKPSTIPDKTVKALTVSGAESFTNWLNLPHIKRSITKVPEDQKKILENDAVWLPPRPGRTFKAPSLPLSVLTQIWSSKEQQSIVKEEDSSIITSNFQTREDAQNLSSDEYKPETEEIEVSEEEDLEDSNDEELPWELTPSGKSTRDIDSLPADTPSRSIADTPHTLRPKPQSTGDFPTATPSVTPHVLLHTPLLNPKSTDDPAGSMVAPSQQSSGPPRKDADVSELPRDKETVVKRFKDASPSLFIPMDEEIEEVEKETEPEPALIEDPFVSSDPKKKKPRRSLPSSWVPEHSQQSSFLGAFVSSSKKAPISSPFQNSTGQSSASPILLDTLRQISHNRSLRASGTSSAPRLSLREMAGIQNGNPTEKTKDPFTSSGVIPETPHPILKTKAAPTIMSENPSPWKTTAPQPTVILSSEINGKRRAESSIPSEPAEKRAKTVRPIYNMTQDEPVSEDPSRQIALERARFYHEAGSKTPPLQRKLKVLRTSQSSPGLRARSVDGSVKKSPSVSFKLEPTVRRERSPSFRTPMTSPSEARTQDQPSTRLSRSPKLAEEEPPSTSSTRRASVTSDSMQIDARSSPHGSIEPVEPTEPTFQDIYEDFKDAYEYAGNEQQFRNICASLQDNAWMEFMYDDILMRQASEYGPYILDQLQQGLGHLSFPEWVIKEIRGQKYHRGIMTAAKVDLVVRSGPRVKAEK
jgi:hypothetical protein